MQWRIQDFPRGGRQLPKVPLFFNFCRKLHENERIWTPRGGARPWRPLGSANVMAYQFLAFRTIDIIELLSLDRVIKLRQLIEFRYNEWKGYLEIFHLTLFIYIYKCEWK